MRVWGTMALGTVSRMSDTPTTEPTERAEDERYVGARAVPLDPYDTRQSTEQQKPEQAKPHDPEQAWTNPDDPAQAEQQPGVPQQTEDQPEA